METIKFWIPLLTILFSGLMAGLFFAYACSVNPGLHTLSDSEYLKAMQSINEKIQNGYFFTVFTGILVLWPPAVWFKYKTADTTTFYLFLAAAIIYYAGVFGVTVLGNIPWNNQLAALDVNGMDSRWMASFRVNFETNWNKYHLIRTVLSIIAFFLTIVASTRRV